MRPMSDKKLQPYPEINEAWKAVRSDLIKHPSGMEIARVVRVPTFGVYKRDLEKNAASIFVDEIAKVAVQVKEVDGGKVKVRHDMDFVEGGNSERYRFIPKNEVWVDKNLAPKERPFVKIHELIERARMKKGEPYEKAHKVANEAEKAARLSK
jgi:hypothetical protein